MDGMDDLVQFLRARLDEDEQTVREVLWEGSGNTISWSLPASATVEVGADEFYAGDSTVARHIARHDPERILAEVDAKRRALNHYERIQQHTLKNNDEHDYLLAEGAVRTQIQYAALPYADHPDYRPKWAPNI